MDFREIQYVLAIRDHQTLSGAARSLDITQPSISKFLQNLEKKLQVKLFDRIENKLVLTYAGEQYVETGLKILDLNRQLQNNLNDINQKFRGSISLGITPTRGRYVLPNTLPAFKRQFPNYKVRIMEGGVQELNHALSEGKIDLAIYTVTDGYIAGFNYEQICKEEVVLVISPDNKLAHLTENRADRKHPWIDINRMGEEVFFMVDPKFRTRKIADRIMMESTIFPETITLESVESVLSIIASGIGVGFCTDMCEKYFYTPRKLLFCSVGNNNNEWDFVIAYRKNVYLSDAAKMFIEITKSNFREK
ncbi:MAG: LysR family transcriptional regulator [Clostridiaceae bacterium]|nr:LysR family transcriptional regulator [Clostridiaceae bacterium]